jgi:choline dehydrogenase-like flavoprotein
LRATAAARRSARRISWTDETLEASLKEWRDSRSGPRSSPWVAAGDADIADYVRGHCTTLYHASSTCRMGNDKALTWS